MDNETKRVIAELHPNIRKYMQDNELNLRDLTKSLINFNELPSDASLTPNESQIVLGINAVDFTKWRTDGTIPPLNRFGQYTVQLVRELLANGIKTESDNRG